jgi:hypothetical protein
MELCSCWEATAGSNSADIFVLNGKNWGRLVTCTAGGVDRTSYTASPS